MVCFSNHVGPYDIITSLMVWLTATNADDRLVQVAKFAVSSYTKRTVVTLFLSCITVCTWLEKQNNGLKWSNIYPSLATRSRQINMRCCEPFRESKRIDFWGFKFQQHQVLTISDTICLIIDWIKVVSEMSKYRKSKEVKCAMKYFHLILELVNDIITVTHNFAWRYFRMRLPTWIYSQNFIFAFCNILICNPFIRNY